jgi:hypothetical protein
LFFDQPAFKLAAVEEGVLEEKKPRRVSRHEVFEGFARVPEPQFATVTMAPTEVPDVVREGPKAIVSRVHSKSQDLLIEGFKKRLESLKLEYLKLKKRFEKSRV